MRIMLIGDTHAESHWFSTFITSDCEVCIQLGDFGFIWKKDDVKHNKFLNKFEEDYPNKTIFTVLGNHENYDLIYNFFPTVEKNGAQCFKLRENVYAVKRGEVLNLDGVTFLCVGGADSTDKGWRIETEAYYRDLGEVRKLWWPQEKITQDDIDNAIANVNKQENQSVDFICTHAEPYRFVQKIFPHAQDSSSELLLNDLWAQIRYGYWFGGHIHETNSDITASIYSLGIGETVIIDTETKEIEADCFD